MGFDALSALDVVALAIFAVAWLGYAAMVDHGPYSARTLSSAMDRQRHVWVTQMQARENRIADVQILSGLQQGTAFFASASMLAIGAGLALISASERMVGLVSDIAPAGASTPALFEAKIVGLIVIFVYAFFKFGWSYRVFNYASILVGALPPADRRGTPEAQAAIDRAAVFIRLGGRHFNRGQRAFNFSLAFLGWFAGPLVLIGGSALVLAVLVHRQFFSLSARSARGDA